MMIRNFRRFSNCRRVLNKSENSSAEIQKDLTFDFKDEQTDPSTTAKNKEHEIFSRIFDNILLENADKTAQNTSSQPLTTGLRRVFNPTPRMSSRTASAQPLSMIKEASLLEWVEPDTEYLRPVFMHIQGLESNVEIVDYFKKQVVPNFDPNCRDWTHPTVTGPFSHASLPHVFRAVLKALVELNDPQSALNLFFHTKTSDGPVRDAAALTPEAYNTIIAIHWEYYRDPKSIVDLMFEMSVNAVAGDAVTANLLSRITQEILNAKRGNDAHESLPLWDARDDKRVDMIIHHRRCIVDVLADRSGMPKPIWGSLT